MEESRRTTYKTFPPLRLLLSPSVKCTAMEDLPRHLILDILGRLTDSSDVGRCRVVSKTFNSISHDVDSITVLCSLSRYLRSRSPDNISLLIPFKSLVADAILSWRGVVGSISIGVDGSLAGCSEDMEEDESGDDMYLTDAGFIAGWLPRVCEGLRALSISDFWVQSCWRRSEVLALLSSCCECSDSLCVSVFFLKKMTMKSVSWPN